MAEATSRMKQWAKRQQAAQAQQLSQPAPAPAQPVAAQEGHGSNVPLDAIIQIWKENRTQQGPAYGFLAAGIIDPATKKSIEWHEIKINLDGTELQQLQAELQQYPVSKYNLYWASMVFNQPRRKSEFVMPVTYLWSDMDEAPLDRIQQMGLQPTLIWQTSPGRHSGLWKLDQQLAPADAEALNEALTYAIGADNSGWDIGQMLRLPGTKNYKYQGSPVVGPFKPGPMPMYRVDDIRRQVQALPVATTSPRKVNIPQATPAQVQQLLQKHHSRMGQPFINMLFDPAALKDKKTGKDKDRSSTLWFIDNRMLDAGMQPPEILQLVKASVWNKYRGRSDEDIRLKTELEKIIVGKLVDEIETATENNPYPSLVLKSVLELINSHTKVEWLVQDWVIQGSKLLISGPPKAFKSLIAVDDLAVSVASGKDFLGHFMVNKTGPVIIYQGENSEALEKDRFRKIMASKGIPEGTDLPLYVISNQGLALNEPMSLARLEEAIQKIQPVLVIIDPLYTAYAGDMSSQKDTVPMLNALTQLRDKYGCVMGIATHDNKGSGQNTPKGAGGRVYGTQFFRGWYECGIFIDLDKDEVEDMGDELITDMSTASTQLPPKTIIVSRACRMAPTMQRLSITVDLGLVGELGYTVIVEPYKARALRTTEEQRADKQEKMDEAIIKMVKINPGESATNISKRLKGYFRDKTVTGRMPELVKMGKLRRKKHECGVGFNYFPVHEPASTEEM